MLPATLMGGGLPVDFINEQRALAEEAANAAMTRLEEMARRTGVAVEARLETTSMAGAADIFGHLARRFDLSIVGQANPDVVGPQELIIEAALFQSGTTSGGRALHPEDWAHAQSRSCVLGRRAQSGARD